MERDWEAAQQHMPQQALKLSEFGEISQAWKAQSTPLHLHPTNKSVGVQQFLWVLLKFKHSQLSSSKQNKVGRMVQQTAR